MKLGLCPPSPMSLELDIFSLKDICVSQGTRHMEEYSKHREVNFWFLVLKFAPYPTVHRVYYWLHLGITPNRARCTIYGVRNCTWVMCMQHKALATEQPLQLKLTVKKQILLKEHYMLNTSVCLSQNVWIKYVSEETVTILEWQGHIGAYRTCKHRRPHLRTVDDCQYF